MTTTHFHIRRAAAVRGFGPRVLAVFTVSVVIVAWSGSVQADGGQLVIGADGGLVKPFLNESDVEDIDAGAAFGFGVRFGYGLSDQATLEMGYTHAETEADLGHSRRIGLVSDEMILGFNWSISNAAFRPQFLTGLTYHMMRLDPPINDEASFGLTAGLGFMGVITPELHAGVRARYHYQFPEELDAIQLVTVMGALDFWL